MATNTYVALATQTTTGTVSSVTFTSIPSGYTDLVLVATASRGITGSGSADFNMTFNGDTANNYSVTLLYEAPASTRSSNRANLNWMGAVGDGNNLQSIVQIQNYSNTNVNKTALGRWGSPTDGIVRASVGLWRSTSAITSLTITPTNGIAAGATFTIYGIASQPAPTAKATGGTITYDVSYTYHTFTSSGTFTPLQSLNVDYLAIAGGGGGGYSFGGGGGAGGFLTANNYAVTATGYGITVGAGGAGGTSGAGTSGGNSVFGSFVSVGGGGGGSDMGDPDNGANGGSGGGSAIDPSTTATGTAGQGNNGGLGSRDNSRLGGGGGGGAGAVGGNNNGAGTAGAGGNGLATTFTGTSVTYAGGGGAGGSSSYSTVGGAAGTGGAGAGGVGGGAGGNASGNTGSGGGGGQQGNNGGNGGSGIVIIRYAN